MGFSAFTTPEYLQQSLTGIFVFRFRVPQDCKAFLRKSELKYSLKTRSLREARKRVAAIVDFIEELCNDIRLGKVTENGEETIKTFQRFIDIVRCSNGFARWSEKFCSIASSTPLQEGPAVQNPPAPEPYLYATETKAPPQSLFSDVAQAFIDEKKLSKGWREKTLEDQRAVFALFKEIFGDIAVETIDKALMREFKSTILLLPPNMRKIGKYQGKSIAEIIEMKPEKTISSHTINKYLSRISNFLSYAVDHGFLASNPASGLKVKLKSRPDEERNIFTEEDLEKLFEYPEDSKGYTFWTPLIALFSGARLEEISQLHLEDIRKEKGVWVFDINDKGEKYLKTISSSRYIPIHPELINIGLLDYVAHLKAKGEDRLFPELRRRRDGYGQTVSKWFQRFKVRCGIGKGKTFHSFRHTFITHLKHKQVDPYIIHELDGHTINSETMGRYGKRYTPDILLREGIEKLSFTINTKDNS